MLTINSWLYFYIYDYTQIYDHLGYLMIIVKKKKTYQNRPTTIAMFGDEQIIQN